MSHTSRNAFSVRCDGFNPSRPSLSHTRAREKSCSRDVHPSRRRGPRRRALAVAARGEHEALEAAGQQRLDFAQAGEAPKRDPLAEVFN